MTQKTATTESKQLTISKDVVDQLLKEIDDLKTENAVLYNTINSLEEKNKALSTKINPPIARGFYRRII